jgi:hypothetical protein
VGEVEPGAGRQLQRVAFGPGADPVAAAEEQRALDEADRAVVALGDAVVVVAQPPGRIRPISIYRDSIAS